MSRKGFSRKWTECIATADAFVTLAFTVITTGGNTKAISIVDKISFSRVWRWRLHQSSKAQLLFAARHQLHANLNQENEDSIATWCNNAQGRLQAFLALTTNWYVLKTTRDSRNSPTSRVHEVREHLSVLTNWSISFLAFNENKYLMSP